MGIKGKGWEFLGSKVAIVAGNKVAQKKMKRQEKKKWKGFREEGRRGGGKKGEGMLQRIFCAVRDLTGFWLGPLRSLDQEDRAVKILWCIVCNPRILNCI